MLLDRVFLLKGAILLPGVLLLAWRATSTPFAALWRDPTALVAIYWIFLAVRTRKESTAPLALALMGFLLGIHLSAQAPRVLGLFGFTP